MFTWPGRLLIVVKFNARIFSYSDLHSKTTKRKTRICNHTLIIIGGFKESSDVAETGGTRMLKYCTLLLQSLVLNPLPLARQVNNIIIIIMRGLKLQLCA